MCAKDDLIRRKGLLSTSTQTWEVLFQTHDRRLAGELATAESNILSLIAFIISHRLFADELNIQQSLLDRATVVLIIISVNKTQLSLILGDVAAYTLLAKFIPITKIRDPLLKSQVYHYCIGKLLLRKFKHYYISLHGRTLLLTKHYNFNIHVSLATDTLHLLLKGLVIKMLDFMQDMLDDIYPSKQKVIIQQLVAVVSLLFVSKAPFALHFIRAVCDLVTLAQYKNIRMYGALDSICTRANSEAHYITIVKQFYSMTNKKEYILQICLHNSQRTALLAANYATVVKQSRPSTTVNIQDCTYSTRDRLDVDPSWVGRMSVQIHPSIKCWRSSSKRHNDSEHCDEETGLWRRDYVWVQEFKHRDNRRQSRTVTDSRVVAQLYLILTIIDYTCYDKDRKHIAYIRAFSEVLLFNNNRQIDNTTRMLSVPFKFYDLSTIIRSVHLVPRDLPNLTTYTTISYYVNNYID
ncbi:hypothetical protein HBI88_043500 [Parastagonospora nodorum]|nr:hypothetical protein HBI97_052760 [Parastagonospora nodorum]KAH5805842.1 hypothetical protein HBI96_108380 [Parastagonospora nodorum]KAH5830137.1 hypothetical protein HBI94_037860 [Parastagonospora nodorum]KAH5834284.1 hypothetical protein HBI93_098540 [Parastagonospora nodorum]KAH5870356.1 hypothetical protein HBI90_095330 [Parastagonospora nodorum]